MDCGVAGIAPFWRIFRYRLTSVDRNIKCAASLAVQRESIIREYAIVEFQGYANIMYALDCLLIHHFALRMEFRLDRKSVV